MISSSYKKLFLSFLLILSLIAILIVYFTLNKVTINIKPRLVTKDAKFYIDLVDKNVKIDNNLDNNVFKVHGELKTEIYDLSDEFETSGEKEIAMKDGDYPIVGKVKIYNDQDEDQVLIKKTRLLSQNGKIFRLNKKINIPAHSFVEVEVYYDPEETEFESQNAGKFTIPGLGERLQKLVYAKSEEVFIKPGKKVHFLTQDDIDNAMDKLAEDKLNKLINKYKVEYSKNDDFVLAYKAERLEEKTDYSLGDISDKFQANLKLKIVLALLNKDEVYKIIDKKLHDNLDPAYELVNLSFDDLKLYLENYDLEKKTANIQVLASGDLRITAKSSKLDKSNFVGLTREQLSRYFKTMDDVEEVEIKFYPSFLSKVPSILNNIEVNIK